MNRDSIPLMLVREVRREARAALFWFLAGLGVSCLIALGLDVAGRLS